MLNKSNKKVNYLKAFLKRKVLSLFLKTDTEELFFMSDSKVFQSVGAATEKDLAPYVFKLNRGITRRFSDDERS